MKPLLEVKNLSIQARDGNEVVSLVKDISFSIREKEVLGIVGESGSGKSMTALSIMGLLKKNINVNEGIINFSDQDLTKISKKALRKMCGKDMGIVFQEPMMALNPFFKIGKQVSEPLIQHLKLTKNAAYDRSVELLNEVGISDAKRVMKTYPHELSGGMRQRVLIAIALSCNPKLVIADEPTTALDVIIQNQILTLLKKLIKERETSLLIISHDFGVISKMADNVAVMYDGEIVEMGTKEVVLKKPKHAYTNALLKAAYEMHTDVERLTVPSGY